MNLQKLRKNKVVCLSEVHISPFSEKKGMFFVENAKVKIKNFSYIDKEAQNDIISIYAAIVHF